MSSSVLLAAVEPIEVPTAKLADEPYCFTGLIISAINNGSGVVEEKRGSGVVAVDPRVAITCAHVLCIYDTKSMSFEWAHEVRWYPKYNQERRPTSADDNAMLRGGYRISSYAAEYESRVKTYGDKSKQKFARDFAILWDYSSISSGNCAGVSDYAVDELLSGHEKIITGYPSMPTKDEDYLLMHELALGSNSFSSEHENYMVMHGFRSFPRNSGGPVLVLSPQGNWTLAGVVTASYFSWMLPPYGYGIGVTAISSAEHSLITDILAEITDPFDYVVSSIEIAPTTPYPGQQVSVTLTIQNQGVGFGVGTPFAVAIWKHRPAVAVRYENDYDELRELASDSDSFSPGQSRTYAFSFTAPETSGEKTFRAYVNPFHVAEEGSTDNNQSTLIYTVLDPLTASPAALDFQQVERHSTKTMQVTVRNNHATGAIHGNATTSGSPFSVVSGGSYSLAPEGGEATIHVRYAPTATGNHSGTLSLSGGGIVEVPLSGSCYYLAEGYDLGIGDVLNVPTSATPNGSLTVSNIAVRNSGQHVASGQVFVKLIGPTGSIVDQKGPFNTGNVNPSQLISMANVALTTSSTEGSHAVEVSVVTDQGDENPAILI